MKKKQLRGLLQMIILAGSLFLFSNCKKEFHDPVAISTHPRSPIPAYDLNWETATYLPSNPANVLAFPWYGQVGGLNGNIASDYKSTDGWQLVYNTFNPNASTAFGQTPPGGLYFALYNVYRGLLRFYLYIPTGTANPSSSVAHGLSLYPQGSTASSMLDFEGSDIIDLNSPKSAVTKTNNQQINLLGNWIVCQYEIAYDQNIGTHYFNDLALQWSTQSINVTDIKLSGSIAGTIQGSIQTPASGFNPAGLFGTLGVAGLQVYGLSDIATLQAAATQDSQKNFLSSLSGAVGNALGNSITNFFNGIIGGNSGSTQEVNLTMNATISLDGNMTNSTGITDPHFAIPGEKDQTTADALVPRYLSPMGVINLAANPDVIATAYTAISWSADGRHQIRTPATRFSYPTPALVVNPALAGIATVSLLKTDLIVVNPFPSTNIFNGFTQGTSLVFGDRKAVADPVGYVGLGPSFFDQTTTAYPGINVVVLRLTIQVTPTSGAKASTIVKTFLAHVIQQ